MTNNLCALLLFCFSILHPLPFSTFSFFISENNYLAHLQMRMPKLVVSIQHNLTPCSVVFLLPSHLTLVMLHIRQPVSVRLYFFTVDSKVKAYLIPLDTRGHECVDGEEEQAREREAAGG